MIVYFRKVDMAVKASQTAHNLTRRRECLGSLVFYLKTLLHRLSWRHSEFKRTKLIKSFSVPVSHLSCLRIILYFINWGLEMSFSMEFLVWSWYIILFGCVLICGSCLDKDRSMQRNDFGSCKRKVRPTVRDWKNRSLTSSHSFLNLRIEGACSPQNDFGREDDS